MKKALACFECAYRAFPSQARTGSRLSAFPLLRMTGCSGPLLQRRLFQTHMDDFEDEFLPDRVLEILEASSAEPRDLEQDLSRVVLRPYQIDIIDACLSAVHTKPGIRIGVSSPTGSGKTVIFSSLVHYLPSRMLKNTKGDTVHEATQVLILVGAVELVYQAADTLRRMYPELRIELEQGKNVASGRADVTVATYQTLGRRIDKYNPNRFKAVVVDEAHHAAAPSYIKILSYFNAGVNQHNSQYFVTDVADLNKRPGNAAGNTNVVKKHAVTPSLAWGDDILHDGTYERARAKLDQHASTMDYDVGSMQKKDLEQYGFASKAQQVTTVLEEDDSEAEPISATPEDDDATLSSAGTSECLTAGGTEEGQGKQSEIDAFQMKPAALLETGTLLEAPAYLYPEDQRAVPVLGFTATFSRADRIALGKVFEKIVWHVDWVDMVDAGWLSNIQFVIANKQEELDVGDPDQLSPADYAMAVGNKLKEPEFLELAVETWKKYSTALNSTLVFCVDIEHVISMTNAFRAAGIDARFVHEGVRMKDRRSILIAFKRGDFPVLVNCSILTEGADYPNTDCIVLAKPTKSPNLFFQMIGRGLRLSPDTGKTHCLIIDMVANYSLDLVPSPTLMGLPQESVLDSLKKPNSDIEIAKAIAEEENKKNEDLLSELETARKQDIARAQRLKAFADNVKFKKFGSLADLMNFLSQTQHPVASHTSALGKYFRYYSPYRWVALSDTLYVTSAQDFGQLLISSIIDPESQNSVYHVRFERGGYLQDSEKSSNEPVYSSSSLPDAISYSNRLLERAPRANIHRLKAMATPAWEQRKSSIEQRRVIARLYSSLYNQLEKEAGGSKASKNDISFDNDIEVSEMVIEGSWINEPHERLILGKLNRGQCFDVIQRLLYAISEMRISKKRISNMLENENKKSRSKGTNKALQSNKKKGSESGSSSTKPAGKNKNGPGNKKNVTSEALKASPPSSKNKSSKTMGNKEVAVTKKVAVTETGPMPSNKNKLSEQDEKKDEIEENSVDDVEPSSLSSKSKSAKKRAARKARREQEEMIKKIILEQSPLPQQRAEEELAKSEARRLEEELRKAKAKRKTEKIKQYYRNKRKSGATPKQAKKD